MKDITETPCRPHRQQITIMQTCNVQISNNLKQSHCDVSYNENDFIASLMEFHTDGP